MQQWKQFEIESTEYLNRKLGDLPINFKNTGGANAYTSDIEVLRNGNYLFSIEAKLSPSQSGQFAIYEEADQYHFSPKNKFKENKATKAIIEYLNTNKEAYTLSRNKGFINIDCDKEILFEWIENHYKRKKSKFIIVSNNLCSFKAIIPIHELRDYFDVSAVIRRKQSGTRHLPKKHLAKGLKDLDTHISTLGLERTSYVLEGDRRPKIYVEFNTKKGLNEQEKYFGNFYLSKDIGRDGYYIKVRSNTKNPNVIFSLEYTGLETSMGLDRLKKYILTLE